MHKKIDKKKKIQTVAISACLVRSVGKWQLVWIEQQSMLNSIGNPNIIILLTYM